MATLDYWISWCNLNQSNEITIHKNTKNFIGRDSYATHKNFHRATVTKMDEVEAKTKKTETEVN